MPEKHIKIAISNHTEISKNFIRFYIPFQTEATTYGSIWIGLNQITADPINADEFGFRLEFAPDINTSKFDGQLLNGNLPMGSGIQKVNYRTILSYV